MVTKKGKTVLRNAKPKTTDEKVSIDELILHSQAVKAGYDVGPRPKLAGGIEAYNDLPRCGAKRRKPDPDTGEILYCHQPAGARTEHLGIGRCWLHGGRNKGNVAGHEAAEKRRLKQIRTGELETITFDTLSEEEKKIWGNISITSTTQLEQDLRIISIRELRMLKRMNELLEEGKMSEVENTDEEKVGGEAGYETKSVKKSVANLERMTALEDALTRVGKQKLNIMEQLDKARNGGASKVNVSVGGNGKPIINANIDLSQVPTEELARQLKMLEDMEEDD